MSEFTKPAEYVPFAPGDVFVSCTQITDVRLRRGLGRVLHLGADLARKAELHTHRFGIVAGLGMAPDGVLWAMDAEARAVARFDRGGRPLPSLELAPGVGLGSIVFLRGGGFLCGEHLAGLRPPYHGNGNLLRFDAAGRLERLYRTEVHGGVAGFLGLTHFALTADERVVCYVSETGDRVLRYDLVEDRQLPDLWRREDPPGMCFGVARAPGSATDLLVAVGTEVRRLDDAGRVVRAYALPPGRGWAVVVAARDARSFWAGDFFSGLLVRVDATSGEVLASVDVGQPFALAGVAEFDG